MRHFPLRECGCAIGIVLVLTATYVGAYYAMIDRMYNPYADVVVERGSVIKLHGDPEDFRFLEPLYPDRRLESFFDPIHEIDRKLRPTFWSKEHNAW